MNKFRVNKTLIVVVSVICASQNIYADNLSGDRISIDLMQLSRDSGKSITYLYDNGGTVNSAVDDTPLATTKTFSDTADPGYRLSGSIQLSEKWSLNAGFINNQMEISSSFSDPSGRLEIFRNPITNEFDSAHSVQSSYRSKLGTEEINGIYKYNNSLEFIVGLGHINLNERFRITSDDTGTAGIGTYTIHTDNNMTGVNAGISYNVKPSENTGIYFIGKIGWYNNKTEQQQRLNDSSITRINSGSDSSSSMLSDIRLGINYHFTRKFTMHLDYQEMNITNVALAESHFNTTLAGSNAVAGSNDIKWSGLNLGINYMF